ncbi:MAG TPA: leucyl aminopeptidase family protein [Phycisphaerales bacterium]|nr:leucyl aminopeptidase family protein [Phycisphaerales bacterium]
MFNAIRVVARQRPSVIVVGVFSDKKVDKATRALDVDGAIARAMERAETTGESGRLSEAYPGGKNGPARALIVGLGKREEFKLGSLRTIGAQVGRRLAVTRDERVQVEISGVLGDIKRLDMAFAGRCFGEGLGLIGWQSWKFKGAGALGASGGNSSAEEKAKRTSLAVSAGDSRFAAGLEAGLALAGSANLCRDLSETPPNIATPAWMAEQCRALARKTGLKCIVLSGADLERERLIGLINVGKASINKPCLIRLEYRPRQPRGKPIVLVGKTMTYDTGGLSLKVNNGMVGMKRDKDGGCAVIGAMHAVATQLQPNRPIVALLSVAENSVSDAAYRPDDVITYRNGVTVEVTNTDAEGRLVLADALIWACEKEDPACIVDLATLTGGVVTALGSTFAGLFCEDLQLRDRLSRAMESSGERWWRLPMDAEYRDMMKSPVADIVNSNPNRKAHPIQGAAFLSYFVEPKVPWAHIDIAGVHAAEADGGCFVKGPTGWGVRLLADFIAG